MSFLGGFGKFDHAYTNKNENILCFFCDWIRLMERKEYQRVYVGALFGVVLIIKSARRALALDIFETNRMILKQAVNDTKQVFWHPL